MFLTDKRSIFAWSQNMQQYMNKPLVSVLMPCYNAEKHVEQALRSIMNQTYDNLEIITINDCSTDKTREILISLADIDRRIKVIDNETNLRLIATLNKGISLCNGAYIARMDADDISLPERIEKEVFFLEKNKDIDIVSTLFYAFPSSNPSKRSLHHNPSKPEELQAYMLFKSGICHPASMIRKRVFTELGLKFENQYLHVEDYALWSKAIYKTKIANITEPLLLYRVHENQVSSLNEQLQTENKKLVFKIHCDHLELPQDDEYLDVYASVAECVPKIPSAEYLSLCEKFMASLIDKNAKKPFCDNTFLKQMMSIHWLRLCANSQLGFKVVKQLKKSTLYSRANYRSQDMLIFYFKCLFKIKYKQSSIYKYIDMFS